MNLTPTFNNEAELEQMISQQVRTWEVLDERVLSAMHTIARERFVPQEWLQLAYADCPLPLQFGKHMLTPMLAGRILQALAIDTDDQVLEIGTGSGYLSACLAALGGRVQSQELHEPLADRARRNLKDAGIDVTWFDCAQKSRNNSEPIGEPPNCRQTPSSNEVLLRIQAKGPVGGTRNVSMGSSLVSRRPEGYAPLLSTVFADVVAVSGYA